MLGLFVTATLFLSLFGSNNFVKAEKCEDITGVEKWDGTGHGDNNKSTKKGERMVFEDNETPCKIAEAIDHIEIDFEITGKKEYKVFKTTFAYEANSDDVKECLDKRFKLPNDEGKPELKAYEYKNCLLNDY